MIFELARRNPNGIAVDDLVRRRTWAELLDRATRVARLLRDRLDLRPDEHVASLMHNRVEGIELTLGAWMAGVWITPINRHLQAGEIEYVLENSGARALFTDAEHAAVAPRREGLTVFESEAALDAALADASDEPMPLDGPPGGTMIYTSGTSGLPKGVKRARQATLDAHLAAAAAAGRAIGLDGSGPHLLTGPMYHAAPLLFAMYDQLNGAPIVIMRRWDERRALGLLREREVHHTHLVPTMFVRLLRLPDEERRSFSSEALHLVLHGAAPIAPAVKRAMIEWWGEILVEYWGASECGVCTLVGSADWLAHPGTVGRALPHLEVFAVADDGRRLGPGEEGVLYVHHRNQAGVFEYHRADDKTAQAYLGPGVFTIGDVGRVDSDGYVYLVDRKSNMIISGGVNIYPAEIERVLQQHPAVADVAVFGIPNDEWGEEVKAAVELVSGLVPSPELEADILQFARKELAGFKVPRSIDFEERLPRHISGKLYTRLLRDRYWKNRDRKI